MTSPPRAPSLDVAGSITSSERRIDRRRRVKKGGAALSNTKERKKKEKKWIVSIRLFKAIETRPLRSCAEIIDRDETYIFSSRWVTWKLKGRGRASVSKFLESAFASNEKKRKREGGKDEGSEMSARKDRRREWRKDKKKKREERSEREREEKKGEKKGWRASRTSCHLRHTGGSLAYYAAESLPSSLSLFLFFFRFHRVLARRRKFRLRTSLRWIHSQSLSDSASSPERRKYSGALNERMNESGVEDWDREREESRYLTKVVHRKTKGRQE